MDVDERKDPIPSESHNENTTTTKNKLSEGFLKPENDNDIEESIVINNLKLEDSHEPKSGVRVTAPEVKRDTTNVMIHLEDTQKVKEEIIYLNAARIQSGSFLSTVEGPAEVILETKTETDKKIEDSGKPIAATEARLLILEGDREAKSDKTNKGLQEFKSNIEEDNMENTVVEKLSLEESLQVKFDTGTAIEEAIKSNIKFENLLRSKYATGTESEAVNKEEEKQDVYSEPLRLKGGSKVNLLENCNEEVRRDANHQEGHIGNIEDTLKTGENKDEHNESLNKQIANEKKETQGHNQKKLVKVLGLYVCGESLEIKEKYLESCMEIKDCCEKYASKKSEEIINPSELNDFVKYPESQAHLKHIQELEKYESYESTNKGVKEKEVFDCQETLLGHNGLQAIIICRDAIRELIQGKIYDPFLEENAQNLKDKDRKLQELFESAESYVSENSIETKKKCKQEIINHDEEEKQIKAIAPGQVLQAWQIWQNRQHDQTSQSWQKLQEMQSVQSGLAELLIYE